MALIDQYCLGGLELDYENLKSDTQLWAGYVKLIARAWAICDRDGAADAFGAVGAAVRAAGRRAYMGLLDVRDPDLVDAWFADIASAYGRIDVVVNNAGGGFAAPFAEVSDKGQDALIRENFTSVAACIRAALPYLPEPSDTGRGGGGSIISITSIEAHRAAPDYAVYAAMKAAVENLTRSLALELGDRHVRVNCVAPDVIPTPGIGGDLAVTTPLPYAGHPDDVAAAVVYLASDAAAFVTGTTIHVDGGNHAAGGWHRAPGGAYTTQPLVGPGSGRRAAAGT